MLERFITSSEYCAYMSSPDMQQGTEKHELELRIIQCVTIFNSGLHLTHYFESSQLIPTGSAARMRQATMVCRTGEYH